MEKEELLESFFSLEGAIQLALNTYYQFLSNRKGKKLPPNKNIEYSSEHSEMNFDAFAKNENVAVFFHTNHTKYAIETSDVPLHNHDFYEINYIYRGSVTNQLNDQTIHQDINKILLMNPYAYHSPRVDTPDTILFNILIRKNFTAEILSDLSYQDSNLMNLFLSGSLGMSPIQPYLVFDNTPRINFLLQEMIREFYNKKPYYQQILYSKLMELWSMFARQKEEKNAAKKGQYPSDINEILNYIQHHCGSVSLEEISKKFGFSVSHLSRYINKYTGYKFNEILHQFKMQNAVNYLTHSNLTIPEITEIVGYSDVSYFRKVFKKEFGISPNAYRNQSKQ